MGEKYVSWEPDTGWTAIPRRLIPLFSTKDACITDALHVFFRGQRRDQTPSDATIHEGTLRPNNEKEILYQKSRNEIRVNVGTPI